MYHHYLTDITEPCYITYTRRAGEETQLRFKIQIKAECNSLPRASDYML